MPRLPDPYYLQHYLALRDEWLHEGLAFTLLTPTEQIAVHDYYEPSLELTDEQLRAHRKKVSRDQPSLPQRAGRAYARIAPFIGEPVPWVPVTSVVIPGKRKGEHRRIGLTSLVQPHIDPTRMAQILLEMMNKEIQRERAEQDGDKDAA